MTGYSRIGWAVAGSWLAGCSGEDVATFEGVASSTVATSPSTAADLLADALADADSGRIRVLHLSPDAGRVDVYLDEDPRPLARNVAFLEGSGYLDVPAGPHTLSLAPRGAGPAAAMASVDLEVADGVDYSATAYGTLDRNTLDVLALTDDASAIAPDQLRLQIVHAADPMGSLDLWDTDDPSAVLSALPFGGTAVVDVPRGPRSLAVDTDADPRAEWRFTVPDLGAGELVDLYVVATTKDGPFLVAQLPDATLALVKHDPRVRVLNASPASPDIDVYARGMLTFPDVVYTESSDRVALPAATYPMDVLPAGARFPGASELFFNLPVRAGRDYTAIVWGGQFAIAAPVVDSRTNLVAGAIRLQFVHGADGIPAIDLLDPETGAVLATDLLPSDVKRVDLPAGPRAIGIDLGRDGFADLVYDLPDLGTDVLVNMVAVTDVDGEVKLLAQLPDNSTALFAPRPTPP